MIVRRWLLRRPTFVLLGLALVALVPACAAEKTAEAAAAADGRGVVPSAAPAG